jgi:tetratricopeptide (TPR) repeat protein
MGVGLAVGGGNAATTVKGGERGLEVMAFHAQLADVAPVAVGDVEPTLEPIPMTGYPVRLEEVQLPSTLTEYKVFIATPGGLETERESFRDTIQEINRAHAKDQGIVFTAVGWELTSRGIGRPQAKINEDIKGCDYFVMALWDRWGSPPDTTSKYTSGVEEEFDVANQCYSDGSLPMRDIVVLFKTVNPRQLSDPGPQLKRVLQFRKELEHGKKHFYDVFDEPNAFSQKLRSYLFNWLKDHSNSHSPDTTPTPHVKGPVLAVVDQLSDEGPLLTSTEEGTGFLRDVTSLLEKGELEAAEAKLVSEVVGGDRNYRAYVAYGSFLVKAGRLSDAEDVYSRMIEVARVGGDLYWEARAHAGLAGTFRMRPDYQKSIQSLKQALAMMREAQSSEGAAQVLVWLGDTTASFNKYGLASGHYTEAVEILQELNSPLRLADAQLKLAKMKMRSKDYDTAISLGNAAIEYYELDRHKSRLTRARQWRRGALRRARKAGHNV